MKTYAKILSTSLLLAPMCAFGAGGAKPMGAGGAKPVVNINQDGSQEFHQDLKDVTKQIAANIVQYRAKHGKFTSKSQLLNVPGFGRQKLNLNKNYMVMGPGPWTEHQGNGKTT